MLIYSKPFLGGEIPLVTVMAPAPNYLSATHPSSTPFSFLLLYSAKELMRDNSKVMISHEKLRTVVMRLHLDTINYISLSKNAIARILFV